MFVHESEELMKTRMENKNKILILMLIVVLGVGAVVGSEAK